ncbi:hypothetical protein J7I94_06740 [Streptomyces sp. ISL-12]|uniref:hypothetical protein n=1 Tax=Streptomyces sp. ISL-12 TaxID=2819177 RepID=UPI001BE77AB9|nr:hypothetical protein [Streptomyces sp. ISL-12]MBT2410255.1 hypothetical protein [Streptomyces sp. ISL-12]
MALKKALACTFTALAMAGGAASTAVAADDDSAKFENNSQVLSCDVIEVIDIPILSSANNNLDCSKNNKEEEEKEVHIVDDRDTASQANFLLKKHGK